MRKLLFVPIFPLLLALAIPLQLFSINLAVFVLEDVGRSIFIFLIVTLVVMAVLTFFTKRSHVAALVTGFLLVIVWAPALESIGVLLLVALPFLIGGFICLRGQAMAATAMINAYMVAFLALPTYSFIDEMLWERENRVGIIKYSIFNENNIPRNLIQEDLPSIYHIVLDGYSNSTVLRDIYGFSNRSFITGLQSLGFIVLEDARSPYNQTALTMSSIFSGEYLADNRYPMTIADESWFRIALGYVVTNGPIRRYFDELGYVSAFTDTDLSHYRYRDDDVVISSADVRSALNAFEQFLITRTSLNFFTEVIFRAFGVSHMGTDRHIATIENAVNSDTYLNQDGPLFLLQHILGPHPPFVFDRFGRATTKWHNDFSGPFDGDVVTHGDPALQQRYREGYVEKLRYLNTTILRQVRRIIANANRPTAIIIHGDHGGGAYYYMRDSERTCLKERYSPLLAIYTNNQEFRNFLSEISEHRSNLVNLYRMLFDGLFGSKLGQLPDKSFFAPWSSPQNPYALTNEQISRPCRIAP